MFTGLYRLSPFFWTFLYSHFVNFFCPLLFFANWFCLLIFALCSFWPFKFSPPAWTLFWTALLCMTLKFPRIYYQPYLHSKETIWCSHTKLSHLNGCVTVINDLLSAKEWRKTKLVWRHSISDHTILMLPRRWSRVCFFSFQLKYLWNISFIKLVCLLCLHCCLESRIGDRF